jgi:predicted transcriptional regulator
MASTITLSPETQTRIHELVEEFDYDGPEAVVDEALRVLEERDKLRRLRELIAVGDAQAERGEVILWTPDFMDRLLRQSAENVRLGKPIKDEVKP